MLSGGKFENTIKEYFQIDLSFEPSVKISTDH